MLDKYLIILLSSFEFYGNTGINISRISDEILRSCRKAREDLSKEEIIEKGYNIYEKKDMSIRKLIMEAISLNYIEFSPDFCRKYPKINEAALRITEEGLEFLKMTYTKNYCEEYILFRNNVYKALFEHGEPKIKELSIMRSFYKERSVEEIIKLKIIPDKLKTNIIDYQMHIFDKLNINYSEGDIIFNFTPSLFVPKELMNSKVNCYIEGININNNFEVIQPYHNRKYFVPCTKIEKEKFLDPFYVVAPKDKFPEELNISVYWNVKNTELTDGYLKIVHHFNIKFQFDDIGNMFSTYQSMLNSDMISFKLVSDIDDIKSPSIFDNRNKRIKVTDDGTIEIFEKAVLNNFPMKYNNIFFADNNFSKWRKEA